MTAEANTIVTRRALAEDVRSALRAARAPRYRTMREFAEADIVIPDGPYEGRSFRCDRQPLTGLWFDAIESGHWSRCIATGPAQASKSLIAFLIPILYHLFELCERVIVGVPDMAMAADKWREHILPLVERSRFATWLPRKGEGSRGGEVNAIKFRHGPTLKFMSGGGQDKSRAGFTSRVTCQTEIDGFDAPKATSREADPITQIEARTRAWPRQRRRNYMECTVSVETGRTWQEYQRGTASRIAIRCPKCARYVTPEREHLLGWQTADTELSARTAAHFVCPACAAPWSEIERRQANEAALLVHRGQELAVGDDGSVVIKGEPPLTETLGFRWSAVNNLLITAGDMGAEEWLAAQRGDEEGAERALAQFLWCLPYRPDLADSTVVEATSIQRRVTAHPRGLVPTRVKRLTVGLDLGKWLAHYIVVGWFEDGSSHVVDYGRVEVPSQDLAVERAIAAAMHEFGDIVEQGWPIETGGTLVPMQVWIDAGYQADAVYDFCRERGHRYRPIIGRGAGQVRAHVYMEPKRTNTQVIFVGNQYHISRLRAQRVQLVEINADYWKSWVHHRLTQSADTPGAMALFHAVPTEHLGLAKHLTSEQRVEEFVAGKGVVTRWQRVRRQNHWFDALYVACAAGEFCRHRLSQTQSQPGEPASTEPDRIGEEYLLTAQE